MPGINQTGQGQTAWYREAIIYQLHIKAFYDSDGNGIGDFRGLIQKMDYLRDLGITAVWLLPFYPSPLRDDGYDIADYRRVHPDYNTIADFRNFLKAAHKRGIRVITELVLNHTSDQHPWFQRARHARPGTVHRNYYVWSDTPEKYRDARIIFQDFESSNWSWDPVAKAYYWHRFYFHQPDLNFDNPSVQEEMLRLVDFWFEMGVDGVRLDAVPYLFEREGTNCENLPETHAFLKKLRSHLDSKFRDRMLLAEANQWPEDAVAYFGEGNECHMAFHFPIMPRMFMALHMEDRFPLIDILDQTPAIPVGCQWAIFLRNHDELTLEMVTDEERDYMYRVYASDPRARINLGIRRRLAPLVGNNRRRMELMNFLLFSLPGTPIIYYGDEIGMGDNYYLGDRDGVRTPMQWSPDRNAGFSTVSPHKLYLPVIIEPEYHFQSVNVENQLHNPSSLLWWMRRVIAMRRRFKAFGLGELEIVNSDNPKVLTFLRRYEDETVLVVANLSRFSQVVRLNLSNCAGMLPVEVFSHNRFPIIRESPYVLTLGIFDYYWFSLQKEPETETATKELPRLSVRGDQNWTAVFKGKIRERFEELLAAWLPGCRWFRSKARMISKVTLLDSIPLFKTGLSPRLVLFRVNYTEGTPEFYLLPLAWARDASVRNLFTEFPYARIGALQVGEEPGSLLDALYQEEVREALLKMIAGSRKLKGEAGELICRRRAAFSSADLRQDPLSSRVLKTEQSNSSILYGEHFFLKLFRRPEKGVNPDLEITRFLTEKTDFRNVPTFAGSIEYCPPREEPMTIALLQDFTSNQGDAWQFTLDILGNFSEQVLAHPSELPLLKTEERLLPEKGLEFLGSFYMEMTALLGVRTAEMHLALASNQRDTAWRPEDFSALYQRSVYQSMRSLARRNLQLLGQKIDALPAADAELAKLVLDSDPLILGRFEKILGKKLSAQKIRIHGDYHLGQVLFTGKDFVIIDFEGEPARPLTERRLKRSPLRDVAGMLRSFHYAFQTILKQTGRERSEELQLLKSWLRAWHESVCSVFLEAYRDRLGPSPLIPPEREEFLGLLNSFLLEKALYELGYELNNRPAWAGIPMTGILEILETG
ncbi:MAG: maltose alpha-D-glucosyltransferase [Syntrophotaleaceae bacterium]